MYKNVKVIGTAIIAIVAGVIMGGRGLAAGFDDLKGDIFYSRGVPIMQYRFGAGEQPKKIVPDETAKKKIYNAYWPSLLKKQNRLLFIGCQIVRGCYLFESDLDGSNLIEYSNMHNVSNLSVSPNGEKIAFHRHPNKLVVKKYNDLNKSGGEQIVAEDFFDNPCIWESNESILYCDLNWDTIRLDLKSGKKEVVIKGLAPGAISGDGELLLCTDIGGKGIYLVKTKNYGEKTLLKKFHFTLRTHLPFIWAPDKRHFIFCRGRLFDLSETYDLWVYSLETGKAKRLIKNSCLFGGFWREQ